MLDWKLTTICILVMLPISFIGIKLEKEFGKCYEEISDKTAEINTTAQENIAGVRLVKAFARERHEVNKFLKMNQEYYDLNVKQAKVLGMSISIISPSLTSAIGPPTAASGDT